MRLANSIARSARRRSEGLKMTAILLAALVVAVTFTYVTVGKAMERDTELRPKLTVEYAGALYGECQASVRDLADDGAVVVTAVECALVGKVGSRPSTPGQVLAVSRGSYEWFGDCVAAKPARFGTVAPSIECVLLS